MFQKLQEGKSETSDLELPVERGVGVVLVEQHRSCSAVLEARNSHFVFSVLHKGFLLKFLHICNVSGSLGHAILCGGTHLQTNPLGEWYVPWILSSTNIIVIIPSLNHLPLNSPLEYKGTQRVMSEFSY